MNGVLVEWNALNFIFIIFYFLFNWQQRRRANRPVLSQIENRKSKIKNDRPSFLSRDDGFLFCASFELARERRCKGNGSCRIQM